MPLAALSPIIMGQLVTRVLLERLRGYCRVFCAEHVFLLSKLPLLLVEPVPTLLTRFGLD